MQASGIGGYPVSDDFLRLNPGSSTTGAPVRMPESEKSLQEKVVQLLQIGKWAYYHTWESRHSVAGFPDIIAVRGTWILAIELKGTRGKLSAAQAAWQELFKATGKVECFVWYPEDFDIIVKTLIAISGH